MVAEPASCIALVDARFLQWLQGQGRDDETGGEAGAEPAAAMRLALHGGLSAALRGARVPARLLRVLWYTSHPAAATVEGQVVRRVPAEAEDGGAGLVLAMARDALQLAEQRACAQLLIASDDDRLLATVDAVQARGLRVHLLADDSAADLAALRETDPGWASLLRQADARVVWPTEEAVARGEAAGRGEYLASAVYPVRSSRAERGDRGDRADRSDRWGTGDSTESNLEAIPPLVQAWLGSLSEPARLELQGQLPSQRGLPQEADRELLQQLSHRLGRPLTVPERKLMRELARRALAEGGVPEDEEARVLSREP
jgi:hypothetical protein